MPGFNTVPASGGGGGMPNMTLVGSVYMETYNRTWAQGGTSGYYGVYSSNQEIGYAYFVGASSTTGVPLNKMVNVPHAFTSINIVSAVGDLVSLFKIKVKATTLYSAGLPSYPYSTAVTATPTIVTSSGSYAKPTGALDLVNVLLVGGGGGSGAGHGASHGGGGGGGGGNVVMLYGINAAAPVSVQIGAAGPANPAAVQNGLDGGKTYFGNIFALGGGGGGGWENKQGRPGGNGGGMCGGTSTLLPGTGTVQTASMGLDVSGSLGFEGGRNGGSAHNGNSTGSRGGGGGGALADGQAGGHYAGGNGGAGYVSDISGATAIYGAGGAGATPDGSLGTSGHSGYNNSYGGGGTGTANGHSTSSVLGLPGQAGVVVVRSFTI
jgi:hypothetical protein